MSIDITRLRVWAHATSNDGAGSPANCEFLNKLLLHNSRAAVPGTTISVDQVNQVDVKGIPCCRLVFQLPQEFQSGDVKSIPILIPIACLGTDIYQPSDIHYALLEEIIGCLVGRASDHPLVRLYRNNKRQPLGLSYSSDWRQPHAEFTLLIDSLRELPYALLGLGQMGSSHGELEVTRAISTEGNYVEHTVSLTLCNGHRMSLLMPPRIVELPKDWVLDWVEAQNKFSPRV